MFGRKRQAEPSLEMRVLRAIAELSEIKDDAVTHAELGERLGAGLTTTLEALNARELTERCKTKDGFWADRLTEAGWNELQATGR